MSVSGRCVAVTARSQPFPHDNLAIGWVFRGRLASPLRYPARWFWATSQNLIHRLFGDALRRSLSHGRLAHSPSIALAASISLAISVMGAGIAASKVQAPDVVRL